MPRPAAAALILTLTACAAPADEAARLADEARAAVLGLVEDPVSVRFDHARLAVFAERGLVCGGTVKTKDRWGEYRGFEPYFYARGRGAALPATDAALHAALARECREAVASAANP